MLSTTSFTELLIPIKLPIIACRNIAEPIKTLLMISSFPLFQTLSQLFLHKDLKAMSIKINQTLILHPS